MHFLSRLLLVVSSATAHASEGPATCDEPAPIPPAMGLCEVTSGDSGLLIRGTLLLPEGALSNGSLLADADGLIVCAGCGCLAEPAAVAATRLDCPDAVISPGLIDALGRLGFSANPPHQNAIESERWEHRHDWRRGLNGHSQITGVGSATANQIRWAELRGLLAGVTSIISTGSEGQPGFARNLNRTVDAAELGGAAVSANSFPFGDSSGNTLTDSCSYATLPGLAGSVPRILLLADGIDARASNEYRCVSGQAADGVDVMADTAVEGGLALAVADLLRMRADGSVLIWQPRHQLSVYGDSAPVAEALALGVPVALSSFWTPTGSPHLGRELACAREFDDSVLGGRLGASAIWRMATEGGARVAGMESRIGVLAAGAMADIMIVPARGLEPHAAVVDAVNRDIALVLRGGMPMFGDAALVADLGGSDCELIEVCTQSRRACVLRETAGAISLADLQAAAGLSQPLFTCDSPELERSCRPSRTLPFPYGGLPTAGDADGDGIADGADNCPDTFNPPRPGSAGVQPDFDGDGAGDACDICPQFADASQCLVRVFRDGFERVLE
ncbi:MAG: amidohydrolase family protein [Aquimonas sp.]|nr:amidohydrolase family protein [Aquimonas sp.]